MSAVMIAGLCAVGPACKGGSGDVTWPEAPTDGAPVVMKFLAMEGSGDKTKARVRLFNFADKDVKGVQMRLIYLDANGQEIDTFPWSQMANPKLIGKKSYVDKKVGAFMREGTVSVGARFRDVEFTDGTRWITQGESSL